MPGLFAGTPFERPVTCEHCEQSLDNCTCPRTTSGELCLPRDQHPRVGREKRNGKWCTRIMNLDPHATDLKGLLKQLRTELGTGGGMTEGEILLQGDHREKVVVLLIAMGYPAKPSGG